MLHRLRRCLPEALVFFALYMSHADRLYLRGDDVIKLSPNRPFPLPDSDCYIAGRVLDDFFIGFLFGIFDTFVAPIFGLSHLVDSHSVFATLLFATTALVTFVALFRFARLFVPVRKCHFIAFSLCAYVLILEKYKWDDLTAIAAYQLPLALSLVLLYPVLTLAAFDRDVLRNAGSRASTIGAALLTYLVAFSVTSVELFVVMVTTASGAFVYARARRAAESWRHCASAVPAWFHFVVLGMPPMVAVAAYYDLGSRRFRDEKLRMMSEGDFEPIGLLEGIGDLPFSSGAVLNFVVAAAWLYGASRVSRRRRRESLALGAPAEPRPALRLFAILAPAFGAYLLFLHRLSNLGGKNYFEHGGFLGFIAVALFLPPIALLFAGYRRPTLSVPFAFLVAITALHGVKNLTEVPSRPVTKAETKAFLDATYMCAAHGEERVPVFLRGAELGWPYGPATRDWYFKAYHELLRVHLLERGTYLPDDYEPVYYEVESVTAWHAALEAMRRNKPQLFVDIESSPYYVPRRSET